MNYEGGGSILNQALKASHENLHQLCQPTQGKDILQLQYIILNCLGVRK